MLAPYPRRPRSCPAGGGRFSFGSLVLELSGGGAMCRLFGLTAGAARVRATFWLLDAPDSLDVQSHRNVDGAGIGCFDPAGEPVLDKQPEAAFGDRELPHQAQQAESAGFE